MVAQPTAATLPSTYGRMLDSIGPRALGVGATAMYGGSTVASMAPPGYATTGAGTSIGQIGGYGPLAAPLELAAYGNGRIPTQALESIGQGGHRLYAPAAQAWKRLCRGRPRRRHRPDDHRFVPELRPAGRPGAAQGSVQRRWVRRDPRDLEPRLGPGRRRRRRQPRRRSTGCAPTRGSSASSRPCRASRGTGNSAPIRRRAGDDRGNHGDLRAPVEGPSTISLAQIGPVPRIGTNTIPTHGGRESCVSTRT